MKRVSIILILLLASVATNAQPRKSEAIKDVREGNKLYKEGNFEEAAVQYRKALDKLPISFDAAYNLANATYKQENFEAAEKIYSSIAANADNDTKKASSFHNIGNSFLKQKKYKESIDAYKKALKLQPNDMDTKSNLAYAQKMLEKNGDGGGGGDDKNKDDKDQNKEQNKDNKDDQQDKDDKQDENKDNQDQNKDDKKEGEGNQQQPKLSPQEAQQLLDAIQADERKTQEKVNKEKAKAVQNRNVEKYW